MPVFSPDQTRKKVLAKFFLNIELSHSPVAFYSHWIFYRRFEIKKNVTKNFKGPRTSYILADTYCRYVFYLPSTCLIMIQFLENNPVLAKNRVLPENMPPNKSESIRISTFDLNQTARGTVKFGTLLQLDGSLLLFFFLVNWEKLHN